MGCLPACLARRVRAWLHGSDGLGGIEAAGSCAEVSAGEMIGATGGHAAEQIEAEAHQHAWIGGEGRLELFLHRCWQSVGLPQCPGHVGQRGQARRPTPRFRRQRPRGRHRP